MVAQIIRAEVHRAWCGSGRSSRFALFFMVLLVVAALLVPWGGPSLGTDVNPAMANQGPSAIAWLGTDHLGRPVAWRLLQACFTFLVPGLFSCFVAGVCGVLLGALSGWFGGPFADVLRWLTGTLAALPRFVFVLLACAVWGDGLPQLALAVGIAYT
ncbi:MAG: hypothetical protein GWP91_25125, partial [Rhodobacterales bacterium]|nr:hypothetical protein [Rhodobacterales bacterium]